MKLQAFSLIEVVVALALTTFAIVGILGLFPLALETARLSQDETRATIIARTISNGLAVFPLQQALVMTGPGPQSIRPNLTLTTSCHTAYSASGQPLGEISAEAFQSGFGTPASAAYVARIAALADRPEFPRLIHLQITVEGPAQAPSSRRSRFAFVTHACAL